jgi:hypothetical protein
MKHYLFSFFSIYNLIMDGYVIEYRFYLGFFFICVGIKAIWGGEVYWARLWDGIVISIIA